MAINSISSMLNSKVRLSGLASGLDTDSLIKSMLASERAKLDKIGQRKQVNEWKRDAYREITTLLKTFKDDNFDVLKPSANMRSQNALAAFVTNYNQLTADTVSITSNTEATIGDHTINVTQLATQAQISTGILTEDISASIGVPPVLDMTGKSISIILDGVTKSIPLGSYSSLNDLKAGIQAGIEAAFGTGRVTTSFTGVGNDQIKFTTNPGTTMSISANADVYTSLGFTSGDTKSNRIPTNSNILSIAGFFKSSLTIADPNLMISFQINGKVINVGKTYAQATITDIISAVNKSDAGVEMKYSSLTDSITLKNKAYGAAEDLTILDNSDGLLASMGLVGGSAVKTNAKDATFDLDGVVGMIRNSNAFTIEGNSYVLKQIGEVKVNITKNTDEMISRIKNFVTKYNELIDKINGKYGEKYEQAYQPLTEADKENMDADTIKKWEDKAKIGLLSRVSNLSAITSAMRSAMFEKTDGVGITLGDIGISATAYTDKGKLKIDETKLKESLVNNYSEVVSLFTKESSTTYTEALGSMTDKTKRYTENGLSQRLYDILQNNIRTTNGKGSLLLKAGMVGDITEYGNLIDDEMEAQDKMISSLADKITAKEDKLYAKFAYLETMMNKMNAQSSFLTQQSGQ